MYAEPLSMAAKERLQTLREVSDGFVIAERDLSLRGPGASEFSAKPRIMAALVAIIWAPGCPVPGCEQVIS
jgi:hypothetical protein